MKKGLTETVKKVCNFDSFYDRIEISLRQESHIPAVPAHKNKYFIIEKLNLHKKSHTLEFTEKISHSHNKLDCQKWRSFYYCEKHLEQGWYCFSIASFISYFVRLVLYFTYEQSGR